MHLITGYNGTPHVTSANEGQMNARIIGIDKYVFNCGNKLNARIVSNNAVAVETGEGLMNGRHFEVTEEESVAVTNGFAGKYRKDLIVARYTKDSSTGIESIALVCIKGTEADTESGATTPAFNDFSILDGVGLADFPLYRVNISGINLTSLDALFTIKNNIYADVEENNAETKASILADNAKTKADILADNAKTKADILADNSSTKADILADNEATKNAVVEDNANTKSEIFLDNANTKSEIRDIVKDFPYTMTLNGTTLNITTITTEG